MTSGLSGGREWRQFRLLSRDSVRQLVNAAVLTPGGEPMLFVLWFGALAWTFPAITSVRAMMTYAGAPPDVSQVAVEYLLVHDRLYYIVYAMMAAALLAALMWEALFPNTTDQEALGALPVRPRTVAAARLAAALAIAGGLGAGIALPSAVMYGFIGFMTPYSGFPPLIVLVHLITVIGAALFVFATLVTARGVVALLAGAAIADRLALALQVVTVFGVIELFMYMPTVMPFLVGQMAGGVWAAGAWAAWLPPVWFGALYGSLTGTTRMLGGGYGVWAASALFASLAASVFLYLVPARLMAKRALEAQSRQRAGRLAVLTAMVARLLRLHPPVASMFEFTVTSLARNPRHLFKVAGYLGAGVAIGAVFVITAELRGLLLSSPQTASLTFPLVVIFLAVFGFRSAFNIPTELVANWVFRLRPPDLYSAIKAARLATMALGIVPIVLVMMLMARAGGWTWQATLTVAGFDLLMAALLVEVAFYGWAKVPFTCPHPPDAEAVRVRWLIGLVCLNIFAARGADLELLALRSAQGTLVLIGVLLAAIAVLRYFNRREARRLEIEFDGPPETSMQALNLSEALR